MKPNIPSSNTTDSTPAEVDALFDTFIDSVLFDLSKSRSFLDDNSTINLCLFKVANPEFYELERINELFGEKVLESFAYLLYQLLKLHGYSPTEPESYKNWGQSSNPLICELDGIKSALVLGGTKAPMKDCGVSRIYNIALWNPALHSFDNYADNLGNGIEQHNTMATTFFSTYFGDEAGEKLIECSQELNRRAIATHGLYATHIPTPLERNQFRRRIERDAEGNTREAESLLRSWGLSDDEIAKLRYNFIERNRYKTLFGFDDHAQSYISSEWRFANNKLTDGLEQTGTVAGYLKCIEQLAWNIAMAWSATTDGAPRFFSLPDMASKRRVYKDYCYILSETNGSFTKYSKEKNGRRCFVFPLETLSDHYSEITLGALEFFYRYNYLNGGIYLQETINVNARDSEGFGGFLADRLSDYRERIRNERFHRDNLNDLGEVAKIRTETFALAYLLLGNMAFTPAQEQNLSDNGIAEEMFNLLKRDFDAAMDKLPLPSNSNGYDTIIFFYANRLDNSPLFIPVFLKDGTGSLPLHELGSLTLPWSAGEKCDDKVLPLIRALVQQYWNKHKSAMDSIINSRICYQKRDYTYIDEQIN